MNLMLVLSQLFQGVLLFGGIICLTCCVFARMLSDHESCRDKDDYKE